MTIKESIAAYIQAKAELLRKRSCLHQWEEYRHLTIRDHEGDTVGYKLLLCCKKCGEHKTIKIEP